MANEIEIDLTEVERLASLGLTKEQIAAGLGISERTLFNRQSGNADFAAAIKRGQSKGIATVANALWENATGGNVTAQIFWLKARAAWRDQPQQEVEGEEVSGVVPVVKDGRKSDT